MMRVIDSHTEGEPTRLIIEGGPELGNGSLAERRRIFARDFDHYRRFALNEPRSFPAMVGALLCAPVDPAHVAGLIFFNNTGYLGMCGHATIGAAVTLAHMGRIAPGLHRFETPVGSVAVALTGRNEVTIANVPSFVHARQVTVEVPGLGAVTGDVAWGGNWFFLTADSPCPLVAANIAQLTSAATAIKLALLAAGITGTNGAEIDHVEIFGPPVAAGANSRNFVLCPGGEYDRSPCGTGTSAKLACLAVEGKLAPHETWVQESIIGSRFEARYEIDDDGQLRPSITGRAYVVAESLLLREAADPFPHGIELHEVEG